MKKFFNFTTVCCNVLFSCNDKKRSEETKVSDGSKKRINTNHCTTVVISLPWMVINLNM